MNESINLICPTCGGANPTGVITCNTCRAPLGSTTRGRHFDGQPISTSTCPKCGEPNPARATMCWACYTPLGPIAMQRFEAENEVEKRLRRRRKLIETAVMTSFFGGVCLATASGYLPRRRFAVLGSGLLAASAPFVAMGWDNFKTRRKPSPAESPSEASLDPVVRIVNTMLFRAARDGATQMRLEVGSLGMQWREQIGGEWRAQMQIPLYVWDKFRTHFRLATNNWERPIQFKIGDQAFAFSAFIERDYPNQTLVLTREEVVFSADELVQLVELKN